jgi:hypothetical protein
MIHGGIVDRIYAPFGSRFDGAVFQIGICDDCVQKEKLVEIGDYLTGQTPGEKQNYYEEIAKNLEALRPTFDALAKKWIKESCFLSNSVEIVLKAREIIEMDQNALHFIIEKMKAKDRSAHWFLLAGAILRKGPIIPEEDLGVIPRIEEIWLEWLRKKGYLD